MNSRFLKGFVALAIYAFCLAAAGWWMLFLATLMASTVELPPLPPPPDPAAVGFSVPAGPIQCNLFRRLFDRGDIHAASVDCGTGLRSRNYRWRGVCWHNSTTPKQAESGDSRFFSCKRTGYEYLQESINVFAIDVWWSGSLAVSYAKTARESMLALGTPGLESCFSSSGIVSVFTHQEAPSKTMHSIAHIKSPAKGWAGSLAGCVSRSTGKAVLAVSPTEFAWTESGIASFYGPRYHGRKTTSGEVFDQEAMTAAHPKLPFGTLIVVRNLKNGRQIQVRINDRGPFPEILGKDFYPRRQNRVIDLSARSALELAMLDDGLAPVELALVLE